MKKNKEQKKQNPQTKKQSAKKVKPERWKYISALFIIILISLIAYFPALKNGFVWDDDDYIRNNPLVQSINLKEIFSQYVMGNYHPVTVLAFAIEYHFFGLSENGYHVINLLIHFLNTLLVFYAVYLLSEKIPVALIASLLFGVHPIHVESVAWVSELKDLLYTLFFLASYIYYLKFLNSNQKKFYIISLVFFLLSLLSKAMAASLPVLLILTDYFKGRKLNFKSLLEKIPFFALAVILGIVAVFAQKESGATDIIVFPFAQRIVFACYGFIMYLAKLCLPLQLCAYYAYPIKPGAGIPSQYYIYVFLFLAVLASVIYSLKSSRKIFLGLGFFSVTVFLVLQLLPVGGAIMADRYSYIPSIGIFYLAGEAFYWLWNKNKSASGFKFPAVVLLTAAVIFFSVQTNARCGIWNNGMTLWQNVIDQYQTIPQAYINRGVIYSKENKNTEAISDYNKALELEPNFDKAYNNRGILLAKLKKYDEALRDYNKALELNSKYSSAYNNRGVLYKIQGNFEQAIINYNNAIEYKPNYVEAYYNRGVAYRNLNKYDEALNDFSKVMQLQPGYPNVYTARGTLYVNQKKYDEAFKDYNKAIQLQPDFAIAFCNRGNLNMTLKNNAEAMKDYNKAIEIQPDMAEAYYYRGLIEYDSGNKDSGCRDLKKAASFGLQAAISESNRLCN